MKANEFLLEIGEALMEITASGERGSYSEEASQAIESAARYSEQRDHLDAIEALERALGLLRLGSGPVKDVVERFLAVERTRQKKLQAYLEF